MWNASFPSFRLLPLLLLLLLPPGAPAAPATFEEALKLVSQKKFAEAEALLTTLAGRAKDPDERAKCVRARGIARLKFGHFKGAARDLEQAAKRFATEPDTFAALGEARLRMDDWAGSAQAYDRAIALGRSTGSCHANRGLARLRLGEHAKAVADYDRALELDPANARAWRGRGEARMALGDAEGARGDLDRAIALDPGLKSAQELLARLDARPKGQGLSSRPEGIASAAAPDPSSAPTTPAPGDGASASAAAAPPEPPAPTHDPDDDPPAGPYAGIPGITALPPDADPAPPAQEPPPPEELADASLDPFDHAATAAAPPIPPPPSPPAWLVDFDGFALDDPCNPKAWSMKGAPWGGADEGAEPGDSPVPAGLPDFDPVRARDDATAAMEVVRRLAGPFDEKANACFDRLWAPFFDHPTPESAAWFAAARPLLEAYLQGLSEIARAHEALGEAAREAALPYVAGDDEELSPAAQAFASASARFTDLAAAHKATCAKLAALGDPPNPLKGKCGARKRHAKAVASLSAKGPVVVVTWDGWPLADRLVFSRESPEKVKQLAVREGAITRIVLDARDKERFGNSVFMSAYGLESGPVLGRYMDYQATLAAEEADSAGNPYGGSAKGGIIIAPEFFVKLVRKPFPEFSMFTAAAARNTLCGGVPGDMTEVPSPLRTERLTIDGHPAFSSGGFGGFLHGPAYHRAYSIDLGMADAYLRIEISATYANRAGEYLYAANTCAPTPEGERIKQAMDTFHAFLRIERRDEMPDPVEPEMVASGAPDLPSQDAASGAAAAPTAGPSAPDPREELRERLAEHQSIIDNYLKYIGRAESERAGATGERAEALAREIESYQDNIEAERMYMKSLETGKAEYWRSSFAERQMKILEAKCKAEVEALGEETRLFREANGLVRVNARLGIGESASDRISAISAAVHAPDRAARLRALAVAWRAEAEDHLLGQREVARTEFLRGDRFDRFAAGAEVLKVGCDLLLVGGSLFAGPQASYLMLTYTGAGGYLEGGVTKGLVEMARFKWDAVDVAASACDGYFEKERVKLPDGGEETRIRGVRGAATEGFKSLLMNLGFNKFGELVQARQAAKAKAKSDPGFEKHLDNAERMEIELSRAKSDAERAEVRKKFEVVEVRDRLKSEMESGGGLEATTAKPEYAEWNARRVNEHDAALAACGMGDGHYSGGKPSTPLSDIDVTPPDDATGRRFVEWIKYGGEPPAKGKRKDPVHHVIEYDDRWVITDTDTTVWKRSAGAGPTGSSAADAQVALKAQAGSDMFATPGGLYFTTKGKLGAYDPEGAFLDNFKKMLDGLGKKGTPDYHTIGKSFDKVLDVVDDLPRSLAKNVDGKFLAGAEVRLALDVDPAKLADLRAKARALRAHKSPVEAGIVKAGMGAEEAKRAMDDFLGEVKTVMGQAHEACAAASTIVSVGKAATRAKFLQAGNRKVAGAIRNTQAHVASTNTEMTRALIARDPDTARAVLGSRRAGAPGASAPVPTAPDAPSRHGYSWILPEREPPPARPVEDPALLAQGKRMAEAGAALGARIASLPKNDPNRPHLDALKNALDAGAADPLGARNRIRLLTGDDPETTLAELERTLGVKRSK